MSVPFILVEEEARSFLPEAFLGAPHNASWQDNLIMAIWFVLTIGYILSMAPILFVSFFFWILAVEWRLDSTLHCSIESFDFEEEEESQVREHNHHEFYLLMDRLQKRSSHKERLGFVEMLHQNYGLVRFSNEPFDTITQNQMEKRKQTGLDASHVHHQQMPPLVKADWN
jgi:hypothetical protein